MILQSNCFTSIFNVLIHFKEINQKSKKVNMKKIMEKKEDNYRATISRTHAQKQALVRQQKIGESMNIYTFMLK